MYLAIKHGAPAPIELKVWEMAERFHWTLEYVENLPLARLYEWWQIEDGRHKARTSILPDAPQGGARE